MSHEEANLAVHHTAGHPLGRTSGAGVPLPPPRVASPLAFRIATMADIPAIDALQKKYSKALGYFPLQQFEGYIKMGGILIAECAGALAGYIISRDRYQKRDELGVVFQLCVVPGEQRKLVGAALVREVFARSAYGCRLYCCWCAQDLEANYFWESMGFVPLAFRAGSGKKRRVHILWERRIREGDTTTPYWYPCNTSGGAIAEDRLAFPIPPGVHWTDPMPIVLPGMNDGAGSMQQITDGSETSTPRAKRARPAKVQPLVKPVLSRSVGFGFLSFTAPEPQAPPKDIAAKAERAPKPPRVKAKNDPKHVAEARELRDRYLEHVNSDPNALLPRGKYEVARALSSTPRLRPEGSAVEGARALDRSAAAPPAALPAAMSAPMSSPMLADVSSPGELPAAA